MILERGRYSYRKRGYVTERGGMFAREGAVTERGGKDKGKGKGRAEHFTPITRTN